MNRRKVLSTLGAGLGCLAGCTGVPQGPGTDLEIEREETISPDQFPIYDTKTASEEAINNADSLVSENPDTDEIFVSHVAQLPNPGHQLEYNVSRTKSGRGIDITYSSTPPEDSNLEQPSVIEPAPHAIRIALSELQEKYTLTVKTVTEDELTYSTQGRKQTGILTET